MPAADSYEDTITQQLDQISDVNIKLDNIDVGNLVWNAAWHLRLQRCIMRKLLDIIPGAPNCELYDKLKAEAAAELGMTLSNEGMN